MAQAALPAVNSSQWGPPPSASASASFSHAMAGTMSMEDVLALPMPPAGAPSALAVGITTGSLEWLQDQLTKVSGMNMSEVRKVSNALVVYGLLPRGKAINTAVRPAIQDDVREKLRSALKEAIVKRQQMMGIVAAPAAAQLAAEGSKLPPRAASASIPSLPLLPTPRRPASAAAAIPAKLAAAGVEWPDSVREELKAAFLRVAAAVVTATSPKPVVSRRQQPYSAYAQRPVSAPPASAAAASNNAAGKAAALPGVLSAIDGEVEGLLCKLAAAGLTVQAADPSSWTIKAVQSSQVDSDNLIMTVGRTGTLRMMQSGTIAAAGGVQTGTLRSMLLRMSGQQGSLTATGRSMLRSLRTLRATGRLLAAATARRRARKARSDDQEARNSKLRQVVAAAATGEAPLDLLMGAFPEGCPYEGRHAHPGFVYAYYKAEDAAEGAESISEWKVGIAKNIQQSLAAWTGQCGVEMAVQGTYRTPYYRLAERLIHLQLAGTRHCFKCGCGTKHKDWFCESWENVDATIKKWVEAVKAYHDTVCKGCQYEDCAAQHHSHHL